MRQLKAQTPQKVGTSKLNATSAQTFGTICLHTFTKHLLNPCQGELQLFFLPKVAQRVIEYVDIVFWFFSVYL